MQEEDKTHKVSNDLRHTSKSEKFNIKNLERLLKYLLPRDGNYPWKHFCWEMSGTGNIRCNDFDTFEAYLKKWSDFTIEDIEKLYRDEKDILARVNRAKLNPDGDKTQRQIAEETGKSQAQISKDMNIRNCESRKQIYYQIYSGTKPETAAKKLREKFGDEFVIDLATEILIQNS